MNLNIDLGGTVDITAHILLNDGGVKEISPPSGGDWGGKKVDVAFVSLLTKIFGSDFVNMFTAEQPQQWLELTGSFEKRKKAFVDDGKTSIKVTLPFVFDKVLKKCTEKDTDEMVDGFGDSDVSISNGFLMLEHKKAKSLFSEQISQITKHVKLLMSDRQLIDLDYILLVGGFGECKMLQDACRKAFPSVTILIPEESQLAIIRGAVLFGHNPLQIQSRVARFSYGKEVTKHFVEGVHKPSKREYKNGKAYASRCFYVFIKKGEEMKAGSMKYFTSHPYRKDQTTTTVTIYKTEKEDVIHVDEPGVTKLATARLESSSGPLSKIETRVTCGHTELIVEARDKKQGEEFPMKVVLDFC